MKMHQLAKLLFVCAMVGVGTLTSPSLAQREGRGEGKQGGGGGDQGGRSATTSQSLQGSAQAP